jgi:hypothetical protein
MVVDGNWLRPARPGRVLENAGTPEAKEEHAQPLALLI